MIAKKPHDSYLCEFHSIEKFIGVLFSLEEEFRIVEPLWLRERAVAAAERVLRSNSDQYFE